MSASFPHFQDVVSACKEAVDASVLQFLVSAGEKDVRKSGYDSVSRPKGTGDLMRDSRVNGVHISVAPSPSFAALFDAYSPAVYGLAVHILGDGPAAEAVAEEVFVRAWRAGVDVWVESTDPREPGCQHGSDRAMSWLLRLTHALASARAQAASESQAPKKPGNGPPATATEMPGLGMYDEALSPEQRCLLARILWHGETIGALAREMGRTPLEIAQDVRAAIARVQHHAGSR